jgi:hypothetical protein
VDYWLVVVAIGTYLRIQPDRVPRIDWQADAEHLGKVRKLSHRGEVYNSHVGVEADGHVGAGVKALAHLKIIVHAPVIAWPVELRNSRDISIPEYLDIGIWPALPVLRGVWRWFPELS